MAHDFSETLAWSTLGRSTLGQSTILLFLEGKRDRPPNVMQRPLTVPAPHGKQYSSVLPEPMEKALRQPGLAS